MSVHLPRSALAALSISASLLISDFALGANLSIYLAPAGNDSNDGLSPNKPLATLQQAIDVAEKAPAETASEVRILIADGTYLKQIAVAKGLAGGRELQIRPLNSESPRPRFDGGGAGGTWLTLRSAAGAPSRIGVFGLEITNYETAISLNGNRDDTRKWNGENTIRNNIFRNIGQIAKADAKPSTAVIRLVNSDHNTIIRNKFINVRNQQSCGLLHAIYVAHDSTDNVIEENTFEDGCGDAIRFRDGSNRNLVKGNRFVDAWDKAPISDWYCESGRRDDCTKPSGECPSFNNVLQQNVVVARRAKQSPLTLTYGPDAAASCGSKSGSDSRFAIK